MTALSKDPARLHETLLDTHTDDPATNALLLSAANYVHRTRRMMGTLSIILFGLSVLSFLFALMVLFL